MILMRAGRLNHRADILRMAGDPPAAENVGSIWVGFTTPPDGDAPVSGGLRSPAPVQYRMRYAGLQAGWYLRDGARLFHVDHVRNPDGKGADWLASCTELVGDPATYVPAGFTVVDESTTTILNTPVALAHDTITAGSFGLKTALGVAVVSTKYQINLATGKLTALHADAVGVGMKASYSHHQTPVATRCFIINDAPFAGEGKQTILYRARLELPLIEVGRAKKGDRVTVRGVDYEVVGLVPGGDDGVVRMLWGVPA